MAQANEANQPTVAPQPIPANLGARKARAEKIIVQPHEFKICEGCDSIVVMRVATCPNCYGYRFNEDPQAVVEQAKLLATREQTTVTIQDLM